MNKQSSSLCDCCAALLIYGHTFNHSATAKSSSFDADRFLRFRVSGFLTLMFPKLKRTHFACEPASLSLKQLICAEIFDEFAVENDNLFRTESACESGSVAKKSFCFWNKFIWILGLTLWVSCQSSGLWHSFSRQLKQIWGAERGTKSLRSEWHRSFDVGHSPALTLAKTSLFGHSKPLSMAKGISKNERSKQMGIIIKWMCRIGNLTKYSISIYYYLNYNLKLHRYS